MQLVVGLLRIVKHNGDYEYKTPAKPGFFFSSNLNLCNGFNIEGNLRL
jgi:hypothetical protein